MNCPASGSVRRHRSPSCTRRRRSGWLGQAVGTDTANDAVPDTTTGQCDNSWLGKDQRGYEYAGTRALTSMGARVYNPNSGWFLSAGPVQGSSSKNYGYTSAEPCNSTDLNGRSRCGGGVDAVTGTLGWRSYGQAANAFYHRRYRSALSYAWSGSEYTVATRGVTATSVGKHGISRWRTARNLVGRGGKLAGRLATWQVGAVASVIDYGCNLPNPTVYFGHTSVYNSSLASKLNRQN